MRLIDMTCPNCGAKLQVDAEKKELYCSYCGSALLLKDDVQHIHYDNAEEAGYNFEKGRQRAQAEAMLNQQPINAYNGQTVLVQLEPPKKRLTWLWVLGWIFIFPVPLTVLMVRKKNMPLVWRIIIPIVAWLVYVILVIAV